MAKFKAGNSGNPAGRPKGSGLAGKLRAAIAAEAPDIIAVLIEQAKAGDTIAAKVLLDRVLPTVKAEAAPVSVPGMASGGLAKRADSILRAAALGKLPADTAAALVGAVGALARIIEVDEHERRIAALEDSNENA